LDPSQEVGFGHSRLFALVSTPPLEELSQRTRLGMPPILGPCSGKAGVPAPSTCV
jgi:hypothetical protein